MSIVIIPTDCHQQLPQTVSNLKSESSQLPHYVYILTNNSQTIYYTGITTNLQRRITDHRREKHPKAYTAKYNIKKLIYYERLPTAVEARNREKQIKNWSREKKRELVLTINPYQIDLSIR